MLRLDAPRESRWLDIMPGVRFKVRPLTAAIEHAAYARASQELLRIRLALADAKSLGASEPGVLDIEDPAVAQGLANALYAKALAHYGIEEWEGIGIGEDYDPVPVTPEHVETVMALPVIARRFLEQYDLIALPMRTEKNGSGPSPNGISATGPSGAAAADPSKGAAATTATIPSTTH